MSYYLRLCLPGSPIFCTATLVARGGSLLVKLIDASARRAAWGLPVFIV